MTEDERRNRNPKPETARLNLDECPIVRPQDLEPFRVYILLSPRYAASFNYIGKEMGMNSRTLDAVALYHFFAPRVTAVARDAGVSPHVFLMARGDGSLEDGVGNKITVRKYNGPDQ